MINEKKLVVKFISYEDGETSLAIVPRKIRLHDIKQFLQDNDYAVQQIISIDLV